MRTWRWRLNATNPLNERSGSQIVLRYAHAGVSKGAMGVEFAFPRCRKCGAGDLVPLSDFGSQGASIQFKAWVCTNPNCLYNVKIRNGDIIINEPVSDGSMHSYRGAR